MPYKITGILNVDSSATLIVIDETNWIVEVTSDKISGSYELIGMTNGTKLISARHPNGHTISYGNVTPEHFVGDKGIFGGGNTGVTTINNIDYITISTTSSSQNFGDLNDSDRANFASCSNGTYDKGVFLGGYNSGSHKNLIDYVLISSNSDASDFGDLTINIAYSNACSNSTNQRGVRAGSTYIDYITINSNGNSQSFGNLTESKTYSPGACSNGTGNRGLWGGGPTGPYSNTIDYVTISTTSNAQSFGDLTVARVYLNGCSNDTLNRGVFTGGNNAAWLNTIDYVTITSLSDAVDFGDFTSTNASSVTSTSNGTSNRGVSAGGSGGGGVINNIEYITISSSSNAQDFGDLTSARYSAAACSNA